MRRDCPHMRLAKLVAVVVDNGNVNPSLRPHGGIASEGPSLELGWYLLLCHKLGVTEDKIMLDLCHKMDLVGPTIT